MLSTFNTVHSDDKIHIFNKELFHKKTFKFTDTFHQYYRSWPQKFTSNNNHTPLKITLQHPAEKDLDTLHAPCSILKNTQKILPLMEKFSNCIKPFKSLFSLQHNLLWPTYMNSSVKLC